MTTELPNTNPCLPADHPLALKSNEGLGPTPPMTVDQFFAEAKCRSLRMLGTPEETRAALDLKDAEIARLTAALKKANDQAERFERGWYLRGDALETALEDLGQATSFASKKARDRHAKTLAALRTALGA